MQPIPADITVPGLNVRRLGLQDLELVCAHRQAMFLDAGHPPATLQVMTEHFRPWLHQRLVDGRYYGFVLLEAEQPVASIGLMSIDWPPHPAHPTQDQRGYVLNVYVEPSHRRRGLATALMQLADAEFQQRGLGFAILHATRSGQPLYQGLGWAATSEMAKPLQPFA
ncbi:GNAT family N-acetyltransferase [Pseudomonas sessilinigenes]|uniref:GNAT family N-acetyltransferase n=1 Tax=Pseudomonas sessilinigenes TaxID=658629 RepID=A0ABX8MKV1_9PSED|nr:GNAT family N-acetyltransferase [Pseudomonas sessilinigenes]AZC26111.1 acetyltransferase [Pseudomonas sessilinigenes]QXH39860.1 GNAT family N-acetyltransferase [Pseudomonas sessilinigenes]